MVDIRASRKQKQALDVLMDNFTKYVLYGGAAGGGKTYLAVMWLILSCYWYSGTRWFLGREELKRLRDSALITFYKIVSDYSLPRTDFKYNGNDHFIQFYNGSRINLLDLKYYPTDPFYERYGSIEYTGGVIEEGGETEFAAFDVLKTRVGRWMNDTYGLLGKILITSNPKKNWLYKNIYRPYVEGTLPPEYCFIPALASENPYLDKGYVSNLHSISDAITRERLLYGNWEYDDSADQLIQYRQILDLFTNIHVLPGKKFITADVARFGKDRTVIGLWSGFRLIQIIVLTKQSTTEVAKAIRELARINAVPMSQVIVDEEGVGGGVVDNLSCIGFVAGSKPIEVKGKQNNYKNLKAQVSYMFAEKAEEAGVFIEKVSGEKEKESIIEEVEQLRSAGVDEDRKLSIISKDKVKEVLGRSPDYSDMIVMRMYFELPFTTKIIRWSIN